MSDPCDEPPPPLLLKGITELNRGEFFAQHETLEDLWQAEPRDVRRLYQGILQIGVALHHVRLLNHHGAMHMLTRGPAYLRPFAPRCQTIDVADLLTQAARIRAEVERLGPAGLDRFNWTLAPAVKMIETA